MKIASLFENQGMHIVFVDGNRSLVAIPSSANYHRIASGQQSESGRVREVRVAYGGNVHALVCMCQYEAWFVLLPTDAFNTTYTCNTFNADIYE